MTSWACGECDLGELEPRDFVEHIRNLHGITQTKGKRSLLMHMRGAESVFQFEWEIAGKKFIQTTRQLRKPKRTAQPASDDIDQRVYVIRDRDGDYFRGWAPTEWEAVKHFALWTNDLRQAEQLRQGDLPKAGYMDLVCGFAANLVRIQ